MGKYNPDWAVAFREDSVKHVYFVAETKGNDIEVSQLRRAEDAKIECARRHFAAISTGDVAYSVVKTYQDLYKCSNKVKSAKHVERHILSMCAFFLFTGINSK